MITQGSSRYPITEICLHTSATKPIWAKNKTVEQMRDEIRDWHMHPPAPKKPWNDIGYHFVVGPDGSIATGRVMSTIGAGVADHNRGVVHICMIPVHEVVGITKFEDWYTPAQFKAVRCLIAQVRTKTGARKVTGHNDYAAKLCPGFKVDGKAWMGNAY